MSSLIPTFRPIPVSEGGPSYWDFPESKTLSDKCSQLHRSILSESGVSHAKKTHRDSAFSTEACSPIERIANLAEDLRLYLSSESGAYFPALSKIAVQLSRREGGQHKILAQFLVRTIMDPYSTSEQIDQAISKLGQLENQHPSIKKICNQIKKTVSAKLARLQILNCIYFFSEYHEKIKEAQGYIRGALKGGLIEKRKALQSLKKMESLDPFFPYLEAQLQNIQKGKTAQFNLFRYLKDYPLLKNLFTLINSPNPSDCEISEEVTRLRSLLQKEKKYGSIRAEFDQALSVIGKGLHARWCLDAFTQFDFSEKSIEEIDSIYDHVQIAANPEENNANRYQANLCLHRLINNYPYLTHLNSAIEEITSISKVLENLTAFIDSSPFFEDEQRDTHFIHELVAIAIDQQIDPKIAKRAQISLHKLETADPFIKSLNLLIAKLRDPLTAPAARARLESYLGRDPELSKLRYPVAPYRPSPEMMIRMSPLPNPAEMPRIGGVHDQFWNIEKLYIGNKTNRSDRCYDPSDLADIQKDEGIEICPLPSFIEESDAMLKWLRDPVMIIPESGRLLLPQKLLEDEPFTKVLRNLDCSDQLGRIAANRTTEKILRLGLENVEEAPFYFEGGNLLPAVNSKGELIYLCGVQNLLFSLLNSHETFKGREELLFQKMKELATKADLFSWANIEKVAAGLRQAGLLQSIPNNQRELICKLCLASVAFIKEEMERTLGHPVVVIGEDLFKKQPDFHLDIFLAPAPGGIVFMNDFSLCTKTLKDILASNHVTNEERERLNVYLRTSEECHQRFGAELEKSAERLTEAGFRVIPTAGVYYLKAPEHGGMEVNFLNSIMGLNAKGAYCISNGSMHSANRYLQHAFVVKMRESGIDSVYFTGREATHLAYLGAHQGALDGGGIHCRTLEITALTKGALFQKKSNSETQESTIEPPVSIAQGLPQFWAKMITLNQTAVQSSAPENEEEKDCPDFGQR